MHEKRGPRHPPEQQGPLPPHPRARRSSRTADPNTEHGPLLVETVWSGKRPHSGGLKLTRKAQEAGSWASWSPRLPQLHCRMSSPESKSLTSRTNSTGSRGNRNMLGLYIVKTRRGQGPPRACGVKDHQTHPDPHTHSPCQLVPTQHEDLG